MTKIIFGAVKAAGVRAIVSAGWGKLGGDNVPENIYIIGNCPHDWLFERCCAVVHHGGAGTNSGLYYFDLNPSTSIDSIVSAGLRIGKPTLVCYFFGDRQ